MQVLRDEPIESTQPYESEQVLTPPTNIELPAQQNNGMGGLLNFDQMSMADINSIA